MAARISAFDWSRTRLGPKDTWPLSLQTAVSICLGSRFPMFVWWGPDLINIYNDAYVPVLGGRHPDALGRSAPDLWREVWPTIGPQAEAVMTRGESSWHRRVPLVVERNGYAEEAFFTWSHSAVPDGEGGVGGVLCVVHEETDSVRAEQARRMSEFRWQRLVEQSPLSIQIFAPDGTVRQVNRAWERLWGITLADLPGYNILHDPQLVERGMMPRFHRAFAGEAVTIDAIPYTLDRGQYAGRARWVGAYVYPVRDDAGRVEEVVLVHEDVTERREAEEALRASEARYAAGARAALDCIISMDHEGRVTDWNPAAERTFGYGRDEVQGRELAGLIVPPSLRDAHRAGLARYLATGEGAVVGRRFEITAVRKDGTEFPVELAVTRVPSDGPPAFTGYLRDISDRLRAEEEVRRSQRQLASIIDNAPSAIFIKDVAGRYLLVNAPFERMAGVPVGTMTGQTDGDLFPAEVAAQFRAEDERVAQAREPMTFEESFEFKGEHLTFVTNKFPLRDEAGDVYAICGIATDVTALKRAEVAVRESEQRLRLGLRAGRTGTWDWDIARDRVVWSEQVYEIHGLRPDEFGGTSGDFARLVHPEDAARVGTLIREALHGNKAYEVEFRTVQPSGEVRWLFTTGQVTRDGGGRPVRMMGALIDTTDRKHAEAERERLLEAEQAARAEAEKASRMKDEFLATLGHELRTPLNAILGWSQILARGTKAPEDLAEGLEVIERNARAQTQIIEDLLDMSRIISGKVRLDVQRVDLATVVREAVATAKPSADAKGIRLQAVLDPHAGPVSGDPARLQQVMWNLLSNAVKFTHRGGRVQVLLERVNSHLEVSVIDTGEGIPPEFLLHVFDRFRQADATITRRHGGLGIGLSIVKQLVELHGGSIRVKSLGTGHGATFAVSLPLLVIQPAPEAEAERRHPRSPSSPISGSDACVQIAGVKVLVVDDEADARALLRRLLEDCGAQVIIAGSAAEALELVRVEKPDVLIADIGMPGEDGYSLIKRVRAMGPEQGGRVPSAALTAYARAEDRVRAILAGFQMHLAKPVEPAELVATVAALAGRTGTE